MSNRKNPLTNPVLIESEHLTDARALRGLDNIFHFCTLEGFETQGAHLGGALLHCTLKDLDFYWGIFNTCVLVGCRFERCRFRGTSFSSCRFVECSFVECSFEQDNLGGECTFDDTKWYACTQVSCGGLDVRFAAAA